MLSAPEGLVWLASFPKSGNTWLRLLLTNLSAGREEPTDINSLSLMSVAAARAPFERDTLIDASLLTESEAERMRPLLHDFEARQKDGRFTKVHDAFTYLDDGTPLLGSTARRALYVVRDPRDIALSYASFFNIDPEQATDDLANERLVLAATAGQFRQRLLSWSGHVRSWLDQRTVPVHVMRYEDMLADTVGAMRGALDFIGASCSSDEIASAARHSAFAELNRQERQHGFREAAVGRPPFFREGRAGAWRDRLAPELARKIERDHEEVMARLGYHREAMETAA